MFLLVAGIILVCGIWTLCEFSDSYKPKEKKIKSAEDRTREIYGDYIYTKAGREAIRIARNYDDRMEREAVKQQFHTVQSRRNPSFYTVGEESREQIQSSSCKKNRFAV